MVKVGNTYLTKLLWVEPSYIHNDTHKVLQLNQCVLKIHRVTENNSMHDLEFSKIFLIKYIKGSLIKRNSNEQS